MPKSLHHPWSRPHPLLHFLLACLGVEVKDLFYFDPYVTSVRLSFSPRYFGGYYSPKREKNYLEKWDPLHVTTRKMTLNLKQREPSFSSDGKGSVKSSRWDEWAQRAKIAPKMLLQTFRSPLFSQQKQSFWLLSPSNMVQIHHPYVLNGMILKQGKRKIS